VDTHAPQTTITAGPSGKTQNRRPTFKFGSSEAGSTFRCALDFGPYGPCTSPHQTSKLGFGAHVFRVRARDRAGNVDSTPAQRSFSVVH
ncbi:MAG: large repetitive protein, partial [Thermoleophilaceae bacterium]|nr:large repetitive protein [Thermoleophilaceae bacterium]